MSLKINAENMRKFGFDFTEDSKDDLYLYIVSLVDYLNTHNKNYTKEQYNIIDMICDLLRCIDVE